MNTSDHYRALGLLPARYSESQLADRLTAIRASERDAARLAEATAAYLILRDQRRQQLCLAALLRDR